MHVTHLSCSACAASYAPHQLHNLCTQCGKPLLVHYDLERAAATLQQDRLPARPANLWRYREVLPVVQADNIVSLGEGWTPLLHARWLGEQLGMVRLYIKDESCNPTGSFKSARNVPGRLDGQRTRSEKAGRSLGRECGGCAGSLCCTGRTRSLYLHAQGCTDGQSA